jgi:hypothetical protein
MFWKTCFARASDHELIEIYPSNLADLCKITSNCGLRVKWTLVRDELEDLMDAYSTKKIQLFIVTANGEKILVAKTHYATMDVTEEASGMRIMEHACIDGGAVRFRGMKTLSEPIIGDDTAISAARRGVCEQLVINDTGCTFTVDHRGDTCALTGPDAELLTAEVTLEPIFTRAKSYTPGYQYKYINHMHIRTHYNVLILKGSERYRYTGKPGKVFIRNSYGRYSTSEKNVIYFRRVSPVKVDKYLDSCDMDITHGGYDKSFQLSSV